MNKIYKLILFIIGVFFLTGCSNNYNIQIQKDMSAIETITSTERNNFFEGKVYATKQIIVKSILNAFANRFNYTSYKYEILDEEKYGGVRVTKEYRSIKDLVESNKFHTLVFDNFTYKEEGNISTIKVNGEYYPYQEQNQVDPGVDNLKVSIEVPFQVIDNNADIVNNNIYTWDFSNKSDSPGILLSFDRTKEYINKSIDMNILGYSILICSIIIVAIIIFITIRAINNKSNKI